VGPPVGSVQLNVGLLFMRELRYVVMVAPEDVVLYHVSEVVPELMGGDIGGFCCHECFDPSQGHIAT